MANYGQPPNFTADKMCATEIPTSGVPIQPSNIVQAGDSLRLRAYFFFYQTYQGRGATFWEKKAVSDACEGDPNLPPVQPAAKVTYYLEDLEGFKPPVKIPGKTLKKLNALDSQMIADGYTAWVWGQNDLVYRSDDSIDITTGIFGSGMNLELPTAGATEGTWQVSVVLSGGSGSGVAVFSSDMFVQILK